MTNVYSLLESYDGEVAMDIYSTKEKAMVQLQELGSSYDWDHVSAQRWEDPEDSTNYIEVQEKKVF